MDAHLAISERVFSPEEGDGVWSNPRYAEHTSGVPAPTFGFDFGAEIMGSVCINGYATEDETDDWKAELATSGFTVEDRVTGWVANNGSTTIDYTGFDDGVAYIYVYP